MSARRATARLLLLLCFAPLLAIGVRAAFAQEPAIPPPTGYVNDVAEVMDEPSRAKLEGFLDQVQKKTGAQFAVLTVRSTAPVDPDEYKVKVFESWGIGEKEKDEGLLLLVVLDERYAKFETGYGLEGTLPDGWQSRMFRDLIRPRFRAGEYEEGIIAGVLACAQRIGAEKGVALTWDGKELRYDSDGSGGRLPPWIVFAALLFVFFVVLPAVIASQRGGRRGWRRYGGWNDWGGGGGWGGGFGGGGGGFGGGGGASFGGFGGGSSGGGGGGGSW